MMHGTDFCNEATDDTYVDPLSPEEEEEEEEDEEETRVSKKKRSKNNKRRFSDEQVKSLETIFACETKLEPRKKVEVARELGLQPRQVAIWFQNKRARWKSKEIEKNYRILKLNYDNLKDRFEIVRKDKESLLTQLQELQTIVARSHEGRNFCDDLAPTSEDLSREHRDTDAGITAKSSSVHEEMDPQGLVYSDDAKSGNMAYLKQEEHELLDIDGSIISSPVKWCSIDAGSLFDQSIISSHWWESWT